MRVLVLGASGFIGSQIARAALAAGHEVRAFCRPHRSQLALAGLPVAIAIGDLEEPDSLTQAMAGCTAVIHAAGYYPTRPLRVAEHLARARRRIEHVLAAARQAGIRRLVYTSSISTIGPIPASRLGVETDFYRPGQRPQPYWDCKWVQEQAVLAADGIETIALIPSAVFGPGDVKPTTGAALLMLARVGARVALRGRVNVVDVRDVAAAHVAALTRGQPGTRYLLGGHNVTVPELMAAAARALGIPGPNVAIPAELLAWPLLLYGRLARRLDLPLGSPAAYLIEAIAAHQWIDNRRAREELGLQPRPLAETLADAIAWFRVHGYFARPLRDLMSAVDDRERSRPARASTASDAESNNFS